MKERNPEKCDHDVYENGELVGIYACSKKEAEDMCSNLTKSTGVYHDWYFVGGRVVIKKDSSC